MRPHRTITTAVLASVVLAGSLSACGSSSKKSSSPAAATTGAAVATSAAAAPTSAAGAADTGAAETTGAADTGAADTAGAAETTGAAAPAGDFDPCKTLTTAEIKTAVGGTVADGAAFADDDEDGGAACKWAVTGKGVAGAGYVEVVDAGLDANAFGLAKKGLVDAMVAESVSGVGTDAYYTANITDTLAVLKGDASFKVILSGDDDSADAAKVKTAVVALGTAAAS